MRLTLVRHGTTDWNVLQRFQGHSDIPLNKQGIEQAHAIASELGGEHFDAIVSSDLIRCRQTTEIICKDRKNIVQYDARWREFHFGAWEGLTWEEIVANKLDDDYGLPHGREDSDALDARILESMKEMRKSRYEEVLIVTHFGPICAIATIIDPTSDAQADYIKLGSVMRLLL